MILAGCWTGLLLPPEAAGAPVQDEDLPEPRGRRRGGGPGRRGRRGRRLHGLQRVLRHIHELNLIIVVVVLNDLPPIGTVSVVVAVSFFFFFFTNRMFQKACCFEVPLPLPSLNQ